MPLPFNKALDLKLLNLVKENQALYNPTHAKYLDVDCREVTWQKIGDALNRPAHICKSRWVNIRDMMRRKVRDRLRHPGLHSYHYKYESELAFMTPFYKDNVSTTEDYAEFTEEPEVEAMSESFTEQNFEIEELDVDEIKPNLKQLKTRVSRSSNKEDSSFSEKYQELNPADPIDVFLLTIGSTLRKFNPYFLNQAKSKIFQVVQEYELQQIVNKDDQGGTC